MQTIYKSQNISQVPPGNNNVKTTVKLIHPTMIPFKGQEKGKITQQTYDPT